ncbi:pheromone response pathway component SRM1 [Histoplasma capsulatum var. duboisii H88]|uniref:GDP/GTP exchange factor n=1 Tax=Ajellomyces capsulatus (strain H88) TaxID=544711 RepID=F0UI58_AJEC8|nr:pheromone response pathway component SRM1 [Histoplasma capsulatum var. duboisii H88]QSS56172.1 GDP/GTP exchange factor [Histoplasma capsulatum var. duboisii H88]
MAPRKAASSAMAARSQTATKSKVTKKTAQEPAKKASTKAAAPKAKPGPKPGSKRTKSVENNEQVKVNGVSHATDSDNEEVDKIDVSKKRKAVADEVATREPKKVRVVKAPVVKPKVVINHPPTQRLNVYVCGEGSSGELGLGAAKNVVDVKRPRLNPHLPADKVGVVHIATGGMHCVALTHDNKILTWGVNDQGALGRDTTWDGGYKDIKEGDGDDSDSDSDSDSGLNPRESTPAAVPSEYFPEDTVFVQVAASDSASFALTDVGSVYGWGTFRSNDGILGFDGESTVQRTPVLLPTLKKIKSITCGANHVLALNDKGSVFAWGSGQQNQLGRRIIERTKINGLQPREFGLPKNMVGLGCGSYHSFAIHKSGKVYAWGLNSFGETGIRMGAGGSEAAILHPLVVESLKDKDIIQICGGAHHSLALTAKGECLAFGRLDGFQTGLKIDSLPESSIIRDDRNAPRILITPTAIPGIDACHISSGSEHSIAIDKDGRAWSWGFSANYQTGQGTDEDIEVASIVENTAVRGKRLNWAGAGGQYSVFTEIAATTTNA